MLRAFKSGQICFYRQAFGGGGSICLCDKVKDCFCVRLLGWPRVVYNNQSTSVSLLSVYLLA